MRECIDYDPGTGLFRWRTRPLGHFKGPAPWKAWNTRHAGNSAGTAMPNGYIYIGIDYQQHYAHRLAWLFVHGKPVPDQVDHMDCDRSNNRIANLRSATHADNMANSRGHRGSITGVKGVRPHHGGGFQAYIARHGKFHVLGTFATLEEAEAARRKAAERLHGQFARHA